MGNIQRKEERFLVGDRLDPLLWSYLDSESVGLIWRQFDPNQTGFIVSKQAQKFVKKVGKAIGMKVNDRLLKIIMQECQYPGGLFDYEAFKTLTSRYALMQGNVELSESMNAQAFDPVLDDFFNAASEGDLHQISSMISQNSNLVIRLNQDWESALHRTCREGHVEATKLLLKLGAMPTLRKRDGSTPLFEAVKRNHLEIVNLLLDTVALSRIDYGIYDESPLQEVTPLAYAAYRGFVEIAEALLLKGASLAVPDVSPILIGAKEGRTEIVKLLLKFGVNPKIYVQTWDDQYYDYDSWTCLHFGIFAQKVEIVKIFFELGLSKTISEDNGPNPFILALKSGNVEIVNLFFENGALIEDILKTKETALTVGVESNNSDLIHYLLQKGASPVYSPLIHGVQAIFPFDPPDNWPNFLSNRSLIFWSPIFRAIIQGSVETIRIFLDQEEKKVQIDAPLLEFPSPAGTTILFLASALGHVNLVSFLLERGASVSLPTEDGRTALVGAIQGNHLEIVELLVDHSPQLDIIVPNFLDEDGEKYDATLLHIAIAKEDPNNDLIEFLIDHGLHPNALTSNGQTPLSLSIKFGSVSVGKLLLENGADPNVSYQDEVLLIHAGRVSNEFLSLLIEKDAKIPSSYPEKDLEILIGSNQVSLLKSILLQTELTQEEKKKMMLCAFECRMEEVIDLFFSLDFPHKIVQGIGQTLSHSAVLNSLPNALRKLCQIGADINKTDFEGKSPLHYAIENNKKEEFAILLDHPSTNIEIPLANGKTPLMYAIELSRSSFIRLLLQKGANPNAATYSGRTVFQCAINQCAPHAVFRSLLLAGARPDLLLSDGTFLFEKEYQEPAVQLMMKIYDPRTYFVWLPVNSLLTILELITLQGPTLSELESLIGSTLIEEDEEIDEEEEEIDLWF